MNPFGSIDDVVEVRFGYESKSVCVDPTTSAVYFTFLYLIAIAIKPLQFQTAFFQRITTKANSSSPSCSVILMVYQLSTFKTN